MPRLRIPIPRPTYGAILAVVLLLTLGVTAALTWQAWSAARSHRAAAERALRDYARFAAENASDVARSTLWITTMYMLAPIGGASSTMQLDRVHDVDELWRTAQEVHRCACMWDPQPRFVFRYDPRTNALDLRGDSLPGAADRPVFIDSLRTALAPEFTTGVKRPPFFIIFDTTGGRDWLVLYTLLGGINGTPQMMYGYTTTFREFAASTFPPLVHSKRTLLPKSLTGGLPNDSLLALEVRHIGGARLWASAVGYDTSYSASTPVWEYVPDGPQVRISLRPDAAARLLIGGLPHSRLPVLLALLGLAGALMLIAFGLSRRATELAQIRADFTSGVSHELRTPLSQILLFAETLHYGRARTAGDREDALRIILREARRLANLVDNVLLFSRTERRVARVAAQPRELAPLVRDAVESFEPLARARGASLRTHLADGIVAKADPDALRVVLTNLLDNAVKYGPDGQTIEITLVAVLGRARLWVDDEGEGIPPADEERIWDAFVRLDQGEYPVATGSGIGLSVVRRLVDLHGGRCWAERAPSGGARFIVELPLASPPRSGEPAPRRRAASEAAD